MMNIEKRPLAEIKPYEKNPRINDAAVDAVAESIRRFGFRQPNVRFVRYADDWCVFTTRASKRYAETLRDQIAKFLSRECGLRLSVEKTHVTHVRDGFDFLGFRLEMSTGRSGRSVPKIKIGPKAKQNLRQRLEEGRRREQSQGNLATIPGDSFVVHSGVTEWPARAGGRSAGEMRPEAHDVHRETHVPRRSTQEYRHAALGMALATVRRAKQLRRAEQLSCPIVARHASVVRDAQVARGASEARRGRGHACHIAALKSLWFLPGEALSRGSCHRAPCTHGVVFCASK